MQINEHHVRERAYYIWENEGRVHGRATQHWTRAESELRALATPVDTVADAVVATEAAPAVKAKPVAKTVAKAKPAAKAAKPAAPKAKASKAAVAAGLAGKAKASAPAALH